MSRVLTNGKIKIGAYRFSDKKKLALCVEEGTVVMVCGYFTQEANAEFFMDKLAECVGIPKDGDSHDKA